MPFEGHKALVTWALTGDVKAAAPAAFFRRPDESFTKRETDADKGAGTDAIKTVNRIQILKGQRKKGGQRRPQGQRRPG